MEKGNNEESHEGEKILELPGKLPELWQSSDCGKC